MKDYKVKEINALSRGIDVLNALTSLHAASLHELHKATGIPKSTLTRILFTLAKKRLRLAACRRQCFLAQLQHSQAAF